MTLHHIHQLHKQHFKARIRLIATIIFHCMMPCHTWEIRYIYSFDSFKQMFRHTFKGIQYILLLYKCHLAVYLRKLRLTVSPQVLIPKALHDLKITVKATHHQKLFESLRTLWQSIKLSFIHPTRDHKVTCTLRSRFNQYRCLHL